MKFKQKGIPGLGERLKQKIDEEKESVAKIAELTGMSRSAIYNIISTDHATANNLYKLCKVLEVSADWLLFGDEDLDFLKELEPGHWIMRFNDLFPEESEQECSVCHALQPISIVDDDYCPNCGAKMEVRGEE